MPKCLYFQRMYRQTVLGIDAVIFVLKQKRCNNGAIVANCVTIYNPNQVWAVARRDAWASTVTRSGMLL